MNNGNLKFAIKIKNAKHREWNDDHLNGEERLEIVNEFKKFNPEVLLPENINDAFCKIIF